MSYRALVPFFALSLLLACSADPAPAPRYPSSASSPPGSVAFTDYTWSPRSRFFVRPIEGCAQAISYSLPTVGYRWGEVVTIEAHSDHWIAGQAEMNLGGRISTTFFTNEDRPISSASDVGDAHRCQASGGVVPLVPVVAAPVPTWDGGAPASPTGGTATTRAAVELQLDASRTSDPRPAFQIFRMDMQHSTYDPDSLDESPVKPGIPLRIVLWGMTPIDWSGVTLEIRTWEIVPNDPVAYRRRVEADRVAHAHPVDRRPHIAECVSKPGAKECADVRVETCQQNKEVLASPPCADIKKSLDDSMAAPPITNTPPPPALAETQPPRPSVNATWVPGHWVYVHSAWSFWSAGFWRVDDEDRAQGRTVTAPSAPPPPRAEPQAREAPPAPTAVWTSGYWAWNAGWQWVAGAWRMPPVVTVGQGQAQGQGTMTWRPATWRVDVKVSGTFRFEPGGWFPR